MIKKISISLKDTDLKRIDDYCNIHNLTRSQFMVECTIEKMIVEDVANGFTMLNKYLSKLDYGEMVSEEDKKLLEHAIALFKGMK